MDLPAKRVFEILQNKGVDSIHHANTVITSCQFLRYGALLSRGTVERRGFYQTEQSSDDLDKSNGLWFDVFTDSVDIHERASRRNLYGPVLFVLRSEIISKAYTGRIWVTKLNPTKWEGTTREERWFSSVEDLEQNFVPGRFDQMIVFRHSGGELPFSDYLDKIILDDPCLESPKAKIDYYSMAYGALRLARTEGKLNVPVQKRKCHEDCKCEQQYADNTTISQALFLPKA